LIGGFLRSSILMVSERLKLLALLNVLFFGCILVSGFVASIFVSPIVNPQILEPVLLNGLGDNWLLVFLWIFAFNLSVGAFMVVTLPGMALFPLSVVPLLFRAFLWGLIVYAIPVESFLSAFVVLLLEGEAYVFAAAGGITTGVSWVKPRWIHVDVADSRRRAFTTGLHNCLKFYVFVVLLLFLGALAETIGIALTAG